MPMLTVPRRVLEKATPGFKDYRHGPTEEWPRCRHTGLPYNASPPRVARKRKWRSDSLGSAFTRPLSPSPRHTEYVAGSTVDTPDTENEPGLWTSTIPWGVLGKMKRSEPPAADISGRLFSSAEHRCSAKGASQRDFCWHHEVRKVTVSGWDGI